MATCQMICPGCNRTLTFKEDAVGQTHPCPYCQTPVTLQGTAARDFSIPPAEAGFAPQAGFPSRMKANKALAGKICPFCYKEIELGEEVFNCPQCTSTMHFPCRERRGGCANPACAAAALRGPSSGVAAAADEDSIPCRFCGEAIKRQAKKCRHCGEFLDGSARDAPKQAPTDDTLSATEIIFGILCGGIACIFGIVWVLQGKKKGWKLIGIALISQMIFGAINAILKSK
jgi:hypothetical protein